MPDCATGVQAERPILHLSSRRSASLSLLSESMTTAYGIVKAFQQRIINPWLAGKPWAMRVARSHKQGFVFWAGWRLDNPAIGSSRGWIYRVGAVGG